jgi:hypothetical protein
MNKVDIHINGGSLFSDERFSIASTRAWACRPTIHAPDRKAAACRVSLGSNGYAEGQDYVRSNGSAGHVPLDALAEVIVIQLPRDAPV